MAGRTHRIPHRVSCFPATSDSVRANARAAAAFHRVMHPPWSRPTRIEGTALGCVTLPPETIEAVYKGEKLSATEQTQYDAHPSVAYDLLSKIPRLEPIARMIEHQNHSLPPSTTTNTKPDMTDMRMGTEILRLTLAYERLIHKGTSRNEAVHTLSRQNKNFSPEFFQALVELDPNAEQGELKQCRIEGLSTGMIIQQEVRAPEGDLLVSKGQEVTFSTSVQTEELVRAASTHRRLDGLGAYHDVGLRERRVLGRVWSQCK
jgi:hypothetical protein